MIVVFNDILDYLTDLIDTTIIRKQECELVKEIEYEDIDKCIEQLKQAVSLFNAYPDGKRRSKLVSQYNSQEKQVKSGVPVTTPLSVDEIAEYQCLQKKWQEVTKPRDVGNDKKKAIKELLDAYQLKRKHDLSSVHNQVEDYWKTKGMD